MPHELVPGPPSGELLESLEILHHAGKDGSVTGIAYLVLLKGGRYSVGWSGGVNRRPTLVIGGLTHLIGQLDDLIEEREQDDTR